MATDDAPRRFRFTPDLLLLVLLVIVAHWLRAGDLPLRGEEPLRVQIGLEMARTGDWIVPRIQGEPVLSRPPLQNWLIAWSCWAFDSKSVWVVRFPSLLAALLAVCLVHIYASAFLPRLGALAAGAACATFAEMFTTNAQAETEAVFVLFVSASLLLWHLGFTRGWPDLLLWPMAYTLVALGMLAKGPQPPVYFAGAVGVWLLLTGQWRRGATVGHLLGLAVGAAIVMMWAIPCYSELGWKPTWAIFASDSEARFRAWTLQGVLYHLAAFPAETLACTMPWSPLLLAYLLPSVRRAIPPGGAVPFLALASGLAFLTIWIPPAGMTRYFAPLYPCLAVLIGAAVVPCAAEASLLWRRCTRILAAAMLGVAGFVAVAPFAALGTPYAESVKVGMAFAVILSLCAGAVLNRPNDARAVVLSAAVFMVFAVTGALTNIRARLFLNAGPAIARARAALPPGKNLASIGLTPSLFAYHFGQPIALQTASGISEGECFVALCNGGQPPVLPFVWEEIAFVSLDRWPRRVPVQSVVVGRRAVLTAQR